MRGRLNEGLRILIATGQYEAIQKRWFAYKGDGLSAGDLAQTAFWVISPILVLLLGALLWSWSLQKQVSRGTADLKRELAERKSTEIALQKSEEEYRNLYETSLVGLWRARVSDGRFIRANAAAARILGCNSVDELLARVIDGQYYPSQKRAELIGRLTEDGHVSDFELHATLKDGTEKDVSLSATLYADKDYIEGAIIDITERKEAEAELAETHPAGAAVG